MQRLAPRNTKPRPTRPATRTLAACVVDPKTGDYQGWDALAEGNGVRLQMIATAEEALRLARTQDVDLWVVNTELPGLSGYELCSMLRAQWPRTTVFVVADKYSAAAERLALAHRATSFGVKPFHQSWFDALIGQSAHIRQS